jgi:acyl carrier protein
MSAEELVKKILMRRGFGENVTTTTRMDELNADSLTLMEMAMELEDALKVSVSDEQMESVKTVGDFIELVQGCMGKEAGSGSGQATV